MKAFFLGCLGIKRPVDANGKRIKEGDKLTWDFHDDYYQKRDAVEPWMKEAFYIVRKHESGCGLCAVGIYNSRFYLHDFRFELCEIVK
jgi:hypothetical protein